MFGAFVLKNKIMKTRKIKDMKTFFDYVKRLKFMQDYAKIKPADRGIYYRALSEDLSETGLSMTYVDYRNIANGVAEFINELNQLHTELLFKAIQEDEKQ